MGCASSKIDDLPAVMLCRERLDFLSRALHQRYSFAEAHVAYIHSLTSLGVSLRHFFDSSTSIPPPAASPVINLPPHRKKDHDGDDDTGSHLHFHSDSDDSGHDALYGDDSDDDEDGEILHRVHDHDSPSSPPPRGGMMMYDVGAPDNSNNGYGFNPYLYPSGGFGNGYGPNGGNMHVNYMKKHVTPSVSYEQRPVGFDTERVQFGGDPTAVASSSSSSSNYYDYSGVSGPSGGAGPPNYSNYYNSTGANNGNNGYMNMNYGGGFYGAPAANPRGWGGGGGPPIQQQPQQQKAAPPPPPPPPPATSTWDFMNLFESIDHYTSYAASRDSREVREEEGIPDLEDEDVYHENEVVKEVHVDQKGVDDNNGGHIIGSSTSGSSISSNEGKMDSKKEEVVVGVSEGESSLYRTRPSASNEGVPVEYEVHMVDKKVVGDPGKAEGQAKGGGGRPVFRNVSEVVHEIQVQFERAASSGNELTKVLEVGKLRYHRKGGAYQVSAKMLNVITPSLPSSSRDEVSLAVDEDVQLRSKNLSATLQKLYLWEKKLFEEVKAEEKMRVQHDRKSDKLKHLADKGAEPQKIESTRDVVRGLSTKIRVAIQMVDRISEKINKLRDEELWPQLNELIQGLSRMWKAMLECHHNQCEAIDGARGLDAIAFPNNPSDSHLEASLQLEHDLLNWTLRFTEWIGAQKGYVRALNGWLLKCISTEPEPTADGFAPFSPGRAGAPPVFVICNQWDQSLERISETSEKELIDSMRVFSMMVFHFRERDKGELRQRMTANRDMERKVKTLEKEDMKMQKKMVISSGDPDGGLSLSGNVVYQSDTSSKTSLQAGLRHVFEAMDRFTADSVKAYDELLQRSEEVVGKHRRVS